MSSVQGYNYHKEHSMKMQTMDVVSHCHRQEEDAVNGRQGAAVKDRAVTRARSPVGRKSRQCEASSALADAASVNLPQH